MGGIDKLKEVYTLMQNESSELKEKLKDFKKKIDDMEIDIQDYMTENNMMKMTFADGSIILLQDTKQLSGFKKETFTESLKDKLDDKKALEIAEHIIKNRPFKEKRSIKYKKKKKEKE
jgi:hypothetical protein